MSTYFKTSGARLGRAFFFAWMIAFLHPSSAQQPGTAPPLKGGSDNAGAGNDKAKTEYVPLIRGYSVLPHKELNHLSTAFTTKIAGRKDFERPYGQALSRIIESYASGSSNLFLVKAENLTNAMKRANARLTGATDSAFSRKRAAWLVVMLGRGDAEQEGSCIDSVALSGKAITVSYAPKDDTQGKMPNLCSVENPSVTAA